MNGYDAVVVGSGPNGLAAAIELARAGRSVLVREAADEIGGGLRSGEVTLPGFVHDVCSAIHPMAAASPFFRTVPLQEHGLEWVEPPLPLAHPLDGGEAVVLRRSVEATAEELGGDAGAYARAFQPLVDAWPQLEGALLGPLVRLPRHPVPLARFGLEAIWPATTFARRRFRDEPARALFAGLAAHSIISLDKIASASFGLVLGLTGHAVGWPLPRGGSQSIADALASYLRSLGGEIRHGSPGRVAGGALRHAHDSLRRHPASAPRPGRRPAGRPLPAGARAVSLWPRRVQARLGALGPDPVGGSGMRTGRNRAPRWNARRDRRLRTRAGARRDERPAVRAARAADACSIRSRAPDGRHTAWAYCHVPNGSTVDMTDAIERQIERFAPGFGERVLARSAMGPADLERRNANLVGGDIAGGSNALRQLIARPALRPVPYSTPIEGVYLCSASTPPGGGVHGMCGYLAARAALRAGG